MIENFDFCEELYTAVRTFVIDHPGQDMYVAGNVTLNRTATVRTRELIYLYLSYVLPSSIHRCIGCIRFRLQFRNRRQPVNNGQAFLEITAVTHVRSPQLYRTDSSIFI